jgi:hypothetical protein
VREAAAGRLMATSGIRSRYGSSAVFSLTAEDANPRLPPGNPGRAPECFPQMPPLVLPFYTAPNLMVPRRAQVRVRMPSPDWHHGQGNRGAALVNGIRGWFRLQRAHPLAGGGVLVPCVIRRPPGSVPCRHPRR